MKVTVGDMIKPPTRAALEKMASTLSRPRNYPNFIDAYLKFTENQESTKKIHTWVAISIMAAALERKVYKTEGHFKLFPNLYTFIIGESGVVRKSTSTGIGVDLLREIPEIKIMSERVTAASLIGQMERSYGEFPASNNNGRQSAVFAYASELNVLLESVFGSISELLTTFYDCSPHDSNKPWVYETKGEGQVKIFGPCLNILGASTPAWLARSIPASEMEGGFASRVIFVVEKENPDKFVAWPSLDQTVADMKPLLIQDLQQIHNLMGEFQFDVDALRFYEEWYLHYKTRTLKEADPRFKGYYGRKSTTVKKIAMLLSVAEGNSLVGTTKNIEDAIKLLDEVEAKMLDAFGSTGENKLATGIHLVGELIKERKTVKHSFLVGLLWRRYNGAEITQIERDLMEMGVMRMTRDGNDYTFHATGEALNEVVEPESPPEVDLL